jgi:hypothetical protein
MNKIKFEKEYLVEEVGLPYDVYEGDFKIMKNEQIDTKRWSSVHELVIKHKGKFWSTEYQQGLTESQEHFPWMDDDEVEFHEVVQYEKKVIDYKLAEDDN